MSEELVRTEGAVLRRGEIITAEKMELLKNTICKGATDDELELFSGICNRLKLDPFARQIFAVKRWDSATKREVMSAQVSIDGFRLVAERTGEYQGQTTPLFCGPDGIWSEVWLEMDPPAAAKVGVHRAGFREPIYAIARWATYVQTTKDGAPNRMWQKMPDVMLAKCAESQALRKAFPNELSGQYTVEEMGQADNHGPVQHPASVRRPMSQEAVRNELTQRRKAVFAERIHKAETSEELGAIAEELAEAPFVKLDMDELRAAWLLRRDAVQGNTQEDADAV